MVKMFSTLNTRKTGFTLIELQVGIIVLLILWLMIAGIELFLINHTVAFVRTGDQDLVIASALNQMDRNIASGIYWNKYEKGNVIDVEAWRPSANYTNRSQDIRMWYRFDKGTNSIYFYPNVPNNFGDRWIFVAGRETVLTNVATLFVSPLDPNGREVFIKVQNLTSAFQNKAGSIFSRTIRLRALW